jgi:hypothetical protein
MREREGSSRTTERRGHGARQRPAGATRSAHDGEGSGSARAGKKAGERERERGGCQVGPTRRWGPLVESEGGRATEGGQPGGGAHWQ